MPDWETSVWTLQGQELFTARLFRPYRGGAARLAVIFPGLHYSLDMPVLYYALRVLLHHGWAALAVEADYTQPAFQKLDPLVQLHWQTANAEAALQAGRSRLDPERLLLVGKSIGTVAVAHLLHSREPQAAALWLTPLLRYPQQEESASQAAGPALFLAGSGDPLHAPEALARVLAARPLARARVLEGADHGLEIPGDPLRSVGVLQEAVQTISDFVQVLA